VWWNAITDRALAEALSLPRELVVALLAAILLERLKGRFPATTSKMTDSAVWRGHGSPASDPRKLTPAQEADLIDRGLPQRLVRSGKLDYASLTSGCMADRIRNGYA
jgi:hypothetical protein